MKTFLIYILTVGVLFLVLLGVLHSGKNLKAPEKISGEWTLSPDFIRSVQESCTPIKFKRKKGSIIIEQSGIYLTITFTDSAHTFMKGTSENGRMLFNKTFTSVKTKCGMETKLELAVKIKKYNGRPSQLTGFWSNPDCNECSSIKFLAEREYNEDTL